MVRDVGKAAAQKSGGLLNLAEINNETHPERDAHRILVNKFKLALPIPMSFLKTENSELNLPWFRIQDWAHFILQHNLWHMLSGLQKPDPDRSASQWRVFWSKYREENPSHEVFRRSDRGEIDLSRCAAILVHGDEGRGRKKTAFLVLSFHSILGKGSHVADRAGEPDASSRRQYVKLLPNFKGHTYTTRYLITSMTKKMYTHNNENVFHLMMDAIVRDLEYMGSTGVKDPQGQTFWMIMLHIVGDWPWLAKCGCFGRSFNNIQKRANANRREPPKGVCHMCEAGKDHYPFEQIQTRRPIWLDSMHRSSPFLTIPPWVRLPHIPNQVASLWAFDLFHSFHLGIGRCFVGGVLALYSTLEVAGGIDERFTLLSSRYRTWCAQQHVSGLITRITKEVISWPATSSFPTAGWHKGAITTVMMKYIEHRFLTEDLSQEPLLQLAGEGCVAINKAIAKLFASNVFLTPDESNTVGQLTLKFLRRYSELSSRCMASKRCLFKIMPKHHVIQKMAILLLHSSERGAPTLNPISLSVQMDEDFIGRPSRVSRRVTSGRLTTQRVLERYLQSAYSHYIDGEFLMRVPAQTSDETNPDAF